MRMVMAFEQRGKMEALVRKAKELTAEALSRSSGKAPSLTEARAMEGAIFVEPNIRSDSPDPVEDPLQTAYKDMMASVFSAINA